MSALPSWPEPSGDLLRTMSYSEWARVRACPLKAAFARDPETRHWNRGSTWSAVGNARHRLVEEVEAGIRAGLGPPASAWVRARLDVLLGVERDRLMQQWCPASVPAVKQWPDSIYVKTRMARDLGGGDGSGWPDSDAPVQPLTQTNDWMSSQPAVQPAPAPGGCHVEAWLSDLRRAFIGRVDRLENRAGLLTVVDLKSGIGTGGQDLAIQHRDQMLFYAGLVQAVYGQWSALELRPVDGSHVPISYDPEEGERLREAVDEDRQSFNAAVEEKGVAAAAKPSASTCAWCPFRVVCPALVSSWDKVSGGCEGTPNRSLSLAAGLVQTVRRSSTATDVVIEQAVDLSTPAGEVSVTRLPVNLSVEPGDALVVAGGEVAGGTRVLRARWDSQIRVERPDR